jgi:ureidoglycolate hydrolase
MSAKHLEEIDFTPYGQRLGPSYSDNVIEPESGVYVTPGVGKLEIEKGNLVFNYLTVNRCPLIVTEMERHVYTSQTVVPLLGCCGLYMLAPQAKNFDGPDIDNAFAVIFDGSEGINIRKGVWHSAPLSFSKKSTYIMVMRNGTFEDDLEVVDLSKKYDKVFEIKI